jgi:hypothetical protein
VIRVKVVVRDVTKIPTNRLMEFGGRKFMLTLSVVQDPIGDEANEDGDDPEDDQGDTNVEDDVGKQDDEQNTGGKNPMGTKQNTSSKKLRHEIARGVLYIFSFRSRRVYGVQDCVERTHET